MKLSIIIPVYNVEKYVGAALDSIVSQEQDLFDYEVIVVDDGTPDNSVQVVEQYTGRLPLTIIRQDNKGLSGARNTGLKHAQGDYVWFVDSDDTLPADAFRNLHKMLKENDAEIFTFGILSVHEGQDDIQPMRTLYTKTPAKYIGHISTGAQLHRIIGTGLVQKNILKRSFLERKDLTFLEGIYHEDHEFLSRAYFFAERIYVTDMPLYIYLLRESGSIMTTRSEKHLASQIRILESFAQFRDRHAKDFFHKAIMNDYICDMAMKLLSFDDSKVKGYSTYMKSRKGGVRQTGIKAGFSSLNIMTKGKFARLCLLVFAPSLLPQFAKYVKNG